MHRFNIFKKDRYFLGLFAPLIASIFVPSPVLAQWNFSEYGNEIFPFPSAGVVVGEGAFLSLHCDTDGTPLLVLDTDASPGGFANSVSELELRIDQSAFRVPVTYVPSEALAYGTPGADLVAALKSGARASIRSREFGDFQVGLSGSAKSIIQALGSCGGAGAASVSPPPGGSFKALRAALQERLWPECSRMGGSSVVIDPEAFRVSGGEVTVDYHHITCPGAQGVLAELGAGNCGAAECLQEVYAPGGNGYQLLRTYWQ